MYLFVKFSLTSIILLLSLSFSQDGLATNKQQANDFLKAYEMLHKGGLFDSSHLRNYLLHPYLDYERLKQNLKISSTKSLITFVNDNQTSWMAEDLNTDLLIRLAKRRKWGQILKFYKNGQGGNKAKCIGLEAALRTRPSQTLLNEALQLWKSGNRRPKVCNPLFKLLKQKGLITDKQAWGRITLAMEKGKTRLARDLKKHLAEPSLVTLWVNLRKNPTKYLKKKRLNKNSQKSRQLIAYGIKRLARKNTTRAREQWHKFQKTHTFTQQHKADVESYISVRDAQNHNPYALQKFAAIPAKYQVFIT